MTNPLKEIREIMYGVLAQHISVANYLARTLEQVRGVPWELTTGTPAVDAASFYRFTTLQLHQVGALDNTVFLLWEEGGSKADYFIRFSSPCVASSAESQPIFVFHPIDIFNHESLIQLISDFDIGADV